MPFHSCLGPSRTWFLPRWIQPALLYKVLSWNGRWRRPIASKSTWYNYLITHIAQLIGLFSHKQPMTACCSTLKYSSSACWSSCSTLQKPSSSPSSTCIDLLWGDFIYVLQRGYFVTCTAAVFLSFSQQHVCGSSSSKSRYLLCRTSSSVADLFLQDHTHRHVHYHAKLSESCHDRNIFILLHNYQKRCNKVLSHHHLYITRYYRFSWLKPTIIFDD